jgi:NADP-dependent 3-hydroxy acid dehydrogenase YdfG
MRVVIAGAGSPLGDATAAALRAAGHEAVEVTRAVCDLTDGAAVTALAERLGAVDGLLHLVGGWRGGQGLAGQSDEDWEWLRTRIVDTLRHTTRAFLPAIAASPAGRIAIVSSTTLAKPTASNANYVAAKAAAEAWLAAVGQALSGTPGSVHVERVMALVSDADRAADPGRDWSRHTDVTDLAGRFVALWP